jgi:hypothetical protein
MSAHWTIVAIGLQQHIPRECHKFISKAYSDDPRIDYHLTYPSCAHMLSLAHGVAESLKPTTPDLKRQSWKAAPGFQGRQECLRRCTQLQ